MYTRLLSLCVGSALLVSCAPNNGMNGGGMQHGNGMMNGEGSQQSTGFLPGKGKNISSFPESKPSEVINISDGQTISLNPTIVRKTINGKENAMYGYNGQIPGPLLKVKQGSTFTVNVTNARMERK